jgi:hypothetical protein
VCGSEREISDGDLRAGACVGEGDRLTDAACGTGDERRFAGQRRNG